MTWAPEDIKRFVSESNKDKGGKSEGNGQSKLNLNSITTINSNLITELPASGYRPDQNIRVSAYVNSSENRAGTSVPGKRNNINLEAVQAYYNTNDNQSQLFDRMPKTPGIESAPTKAVGSPTLGKETTKPDQTPVHEFPTKDDAKSGPNIINNIMHINHSGTNINIMSVPGSQNNFIFNQSAPINLNFYKNKPEAIDLS
jgi:hypothetical protein